MNIKHIISLCLLISASCISALQIAMTKDEAAQRIKFLDDDRFDKKALAESVQGQTSPEGFHNRVEAWVKEYVERRYDGNNMKAWQIKAHKNPILRALLEERHPEAFEHLRSKGLYTAQEHDIVYLQKPFRN